MFVIYPKLDGVVKDFLFGILVALSVSYNYDLPTGYTIIFVTVFSSLFFVILGSLIKQKIRG